MKRPASSPPERAAVAALRTAGRTRVLIVGGGINGIATMRDLALQGVEVVLVERDDFASGATAASSHMIHGGIRYLENGEFRLVRESVRERNGLLRVAPHLVTPLETTIPIYTTFTGILAAPLRFLRHREGRRTERGAVLIKIGLTVYDLFSGAGRLAPWHRFHGRKKSLAALPDLDPAIKYTATYFDASVRDPERLALDVLRDGLDAHPRAVALNYVEAVGLDPTGVVLLDRETGSRFTVAADVVVNASGPWTDLTNETFGRPTTFMGGTKGSHIVLDHPELLAATRGREIFFEHSDGRIVLIYPLAGRVLVGTTDIDADPREPAVCTEEEVDYFFDLVRHVFPRIPVGREHIVYRYSGIRPLPRHEDEAPGFVSRDYRIEVDRTAGHPPIVSLVGGKWTTFRALAESLTDRVLPLVGTRRRVGTRRLPIGGGRDYPAADAREAWIANHLPGVPAPRATVLFDRHGTRAADVVAAFTPARGASPEGGALPDRPVLGDLLSTGELAWMVEHEAVRRLADVVLRRTDLAFTGRADTEALEEIAAALAPLLGWDDFRLDREIEDAAARLAGGGTARKGSPTSV